MSFRFGMFIMGYKYYRNVCKTMLTFRRSYGILSVWKEIGKLFMKMLKKMSMKLSKKKVLMQILKKYQKLIWQAIMNHS